MKSDTLRYLYAGASLSLIIRVGGVGILFLGNLLLARSLPQATYGLYAYAIELVALCSVIAALGFDQIAIRVIPDHLAEADGRGLRSFVFGAIGIIVFCTMVLGGLLLLARNGGAMPPTITLELLGLIVLLLLGLTGLRLAQEALRAAKRIALSQIVEQMLWPIALCVVGAGLVAGLVRLSLAEILGLQIAIYFAAAIFLLGVLFRMAPVSQRAPVAIGSHREWLAMGVPLALAAAMSVLLNRGDILALGTAVSAEELAPYTAASRYAALLVLGLAAASAVAAGVMRDFWRERELVSLQHAIDKSAGLAAIFAVPLALLLIVAPGPLLSLYGPGYVAGDTALRLLAAGQLVNALTGPVALIVIVCDLGRTYTAAMLASVLLLIALLAWLIPLLGLVGAAWSALAALSSLNISLAYIIARRTGLRSWATPRGVASALCDLKDMLVRAGGTSR